MKWGLWESHPGFKHPGPSFLAPCQHPPLEEASGTQQGCLLLAAASAPAMCTPRPGPDGREAGVSVTDRLVLTQVALVSLPPTWSLHLSGFQTRAAPSVRPPGDRQGVVLELITQKRRPNAWAERPRGQGPLLQAGPLCTHTFRSETMCTRDREKPGRWRGAGGGGLS